MLPPNLEKRWPWERHQKGHLYIMGQRVHYESRKEWNTVSDLNIWIWRGFKLKDRDRGMVRLEELKKEIILLIVNSMLPEDLKKSIYDFKILWDNLEPFFPADYLLKEIVEKLASAKITLEFEEEYLANDLLSGALWIGEALISQGFKLCRPYLKKVGMKKCNRAV